MLVHYSLSGKVTINGEPVAANFYIDNLNSVNDSIRMDSELGFYSVNLTSFPNRVFDTGDMLVLYFKTTHNGILYEGRYYHIVDNLSTSSTIDVALDANLPDTGELSVSVSGSTINASFTAPTLSKTIYYLYLEYSGVFVRIDSATTNNTNVLMNFTSNGKYKLVACMTDGDKLLHIDIKTFTITASDTDNIVMDRNNYFDWE